MPTTSLACTAARLGLADIQTIDAIGAAINAVATNATKAN
jgi:hypothetical protein